MNAVNLLQSHRGKTLYKVDKSEILVIVIEIF